MAAVIGLGDQHHRRAVEIGEYVDRQLGQRDRAIEHHDQRADQNEQAVSETAANNGVEHGWTSTHLIDEFGTVDDDALPVGEPVRDQNALTVERRRADRLRGKFLGPELFPDLRQTVRGANNRRLGQHDPRRRSFRLYQHRNGPADRQRPTNCRKGWNAG